jgi:hypothetical protein
MSQLTSSHKLDDVHRMLSIHPGAIENVGASAPVTPISGLPDRLTFRLRQVKQPVLFLVFFDFDSSLSSDP